MKQLSRFHARTVGVLTLGVALELAVAWPLRSFDAPYPAVAAAVGLLVAVLAGLLGGWWVGVAVAAAGWTLQFFFVADESLRAFLALPAWLAAGAAAGWVAAQLREKSERA